MLRRIRALFGGAKRADSPGTTDASPVGAIPAASQSDTVIVETSDAIVAAPESAPAAPSLEERLRAQIVEHVGSLLQGLPPALRETDAPAVLDSLGGAVSTMIRQPPLAAQQALAASRRVNSSVAELVSLFENDPSLAQALLRYANSAYYGGHDACLSLGHAIQRIGTAGVENVVLAGMVQEMLCRPGGGYDALVQQVWSHMVRTGPIAREIAPAFGVEPERAFSLALLHDAGKLVFFDAISGHRKKIKREVDFPHHLLNWALKRLHEPIGGLAALRWGLEETAAHAIAGHHREPPPEPNDVLSEVIFVAEKLDLAGLGKHSIDLEEWWSTGRLTGDSLAVQAILAVHAFHDGEEPEERAAA
jgi:HD-like signal output (HDOD) protein